MQGIEDRINNLGLLDACARQHTAVHRLDARVKIIVTLVYVVAVTSYDRYAVTPLLPFAAFPVLIAAAADIPSRLILTRLLLAAPFAVLVGVFNPLLDREVVLSIGGMAVSGGWISFVSIIIRFVLCMSAAVLLIATTGFYTICTGLRRLRVPPVLTVQLLLLYRYIFLLTAEALRLVRARRLRSFGRRGEGIRTTGALIGSLLSRTIARARSIHEAMSARGMDSVLPVFNESALRPADPIVLLTLTAAIVLLRLFDVTAILGDLVTRGIT